MRAFRFITYSLTQLRGINGSPAWEWLLWITPRYAYISTSQVLELGQQLIKKGDFEVEKRVISKLASHFRNFSVKKLGRVAFMVGQEGPSHQNQDGSICSLCLKYFNAVPSIFPLLKASSKTKAETTKGNPLRPKHNVMQIEDELKKEIA